MYACAIIYILANFLSVALLFVHLIFDLTLNEKQKINSFILFLGVKSFRSRL